MQTNSDIRRVSVIGLGTMGTVIARLLLTAKYSVTVWNRTKEKAKTLEKDGATLASTVEEAVSTSPVTILCLFDYEATNAILQTEQVKRALAGKVLVQLTTGSPDDALDMETWLTSQGAQYLDGAIQVAPDQMGQADTAILISGGTAAFNASETILKRLGGNIVYLGERVDLASAMDLATLSSIYGTLLGFFHGAQICDALGFDVRQYASIVADMLPSFGKFIQHEGAVIQSGDFTVTQSPLNISVEATSRLLQTAKQMGIDSAFPDYAAGVLRKAQHAGFGNEEIASIVKILRKKPVETAASL